jgi:DNA polymerase-3 subunit gamma/tau
MLETLAMGESRLRDATSKKIVLEVTLLETIQARNAVSIDTVLKKLVALRNEAGTPESAAPAADITSPSGAAPKTSPVAPAPARTAATAEKVSPAATENPPATKVGGDLTDLWGQIIEAVGRASPFARSYLSEAHPVSFVKNVLTIGFDPEFADHLSLVDNSKNRTLIQTKLQELGCGEAQVKFVVAEAPPERPRPQPASPPPVASALPRPAKAEPAGIPTPAGEKTATPGNAKSDFKNDPLIKQALEIFKGTIVEVRA